jgi:NRAMP (natural resistance-associated macrophage protein)-like metal ion transporter
VAAAFIGPGTVTTATVAGARFGVSLLWALTFSVVATLVLQEMSARLGLVTGEGLGESIRGRFDRGARRVIAVALVVSAIVVGNAAYQTGNLLGGSLGLQGLLGGSPRDWVLVLGSLTFALLWSGSYRIVERVLVGLVILMSIVFVSTAALLLPAPGELLAAGTLWWHWGSSGLRWCRTTCFSTPPRSASAGAAPRISRWPGLTCSSPSYSAVV